MAVRQLNKTESQRVSQGGILNVKYSALAEVRAFCLLNYGAS